MNEIQKELDDFLSPFGFKAHPFKIGWYNDSVQNYFYFKYPYDTLSFLLVNGPSMFEKVFCPFVQEWNADGKNDPLDECMRSFFTKIKELFPSHDTELIHDFELHHSKRPKVLVQTAGHVAGAAFYYQRCHITSQDPWPSSKKIYGVSLHPKYGGWFGMRGVITFRDVTVPQLPRKAPENLLDNNQVIYLLDKYNHSWTDAAFRDVITPIERYSPLQQLYFQTLPEHRVQLAIKMKHGSPV